MPDEHVENMSSYTFLALYITLLLYWTLLKPVVTDENVLYLLKNEDDGM